MPMDIHFIACETCSAALPHLSSWLCCFSELKWNTESQNCLRSLDWLSWSVNQSISLILKLLATRIKSGLHNPTAFHRFKNVLQELIAVKVLNQETRSDLSIWHWAWMCTAKYTTQSRLTLSVRSGCWWTQLDNLDEPEYTAFPLPVQRSAQTLARNLTHPLYPTWAYYSCRC